MGSWPMVLIQWVCLAIRLYLHGDGLNLVWLTSSAALILRRLPAPSECADSILATSTQPRHEVTWLRDLTPGKPLLGSVSRELYAIRSQPLSVCMGGNQPVCTLLVVIGLSDLHKVTPSVHCAYWSLGIRTLSPTPWIEVSGSGHGSVPLLRVLSGRLGSRLPQARAPVLGVRFSSAWCCAPSENHVPLHLPDPATSLGSYVGYGFMCAAPGLMQCPPYLGPWSRHFMHYSALFQVPLCRPGASCLRRDAADQGDSWVRVLCTTRSSDIKSAVACCLHPRVQSVCIAAQLLIPRRWHLLTCTRLGCPLGSEVVLTATGCPHHPRLYGTHTVLGFTPSSSLALAVIRDHGS